MKALLLIAHGSRSASANDEIRALATQLRGVNQAFALVEHAFLEMAKPNIVQGGKKLIADGADEIIVLPYFLAAGKHVAEDVPAQVALLKQQHPQVKITLASHLGSATKIRSLIHEHLHK